MKVYISEISICLEDKQQREMISLALNMANFAKLGRFSQFRPRCGVLQDPKAWWR
ncbi:hypothetical protein EON65_00385 [archaeon]|nr:MAG: hypothetical protein EON65_00385 [archaeon]